MQYLQAIKDLLFDNLLFDNLLFDNLLFDDLLFIIDCFSSPLIELADGYEVGECAGTFLLVGHDSDGLDDEVCLAQFAELLLDGL